MQDTWKELIRDAGSEDAANKILAAKLRDMADKIEAPGYPMVFGFTDVETTALPVRTLTVSISHPWPG